MDDYYVYAYIRKDNTPYYIGKGKGRRAYIMHRRNNKGVHTPNDRNRIIFLITGMNNLTACALEIFWISVYGRKDLKTGILHNRTNGGEGNSGTIFSEERKKNISKATTGIQRSKETKLNMSKSRKNKQQTNNRIIANENQKDYTIYKWVHPIYGAVECSIWDMLENYPNLTKVGLRHVIYGYQSKHRAWSIEIKETLCP